MPNKVLSQSKIKALFLLVKSGNITLDSIKDEDYKKAVEEKINS